MSQTIEPPTDALVVIPRAELVFVPGGAEKVLSSIKEKARKEAATLDVSRPRDREAMRSLAYKLRRLKTTGDDSGKDLKAEYQAKINPIDAERRVWRSEMDELIAEIIAPAEAFDARETARIAAHEAAISEIALFGAPDRDLSAAELTLQLDQLDHIHPAREWQEFQGRADAARIATRNALRLSLIDAQTQEAAEAEAARVAAEEAARAQAEIERLQAIREAEIARQAAEAARVAAEERAIAEAARVAAEAAERERVAAEALAREQTEKRAAEERAARAEAIRITDRKRAIAAIPEADDYGEAETAAEIEQRLRYLTNIAIGDFEEFAEEARSVILPEIRRMQGLLEIAQSRETETHRRQEEAARLAAEHRETEAAAVALEKERARVEGERIQQEAATRAREADVAHKRKINREARDAIQKAIGPHAASETMARAIVEAIARGEIPNVRISY